MSEAVPLAGTHRNDSYTRQQYLRLRCWAMTRFAYFGGHEQWQPEELVEHAQLAEDAGFDLVVVSERSEERRVGKEGRSRWSPDH